MHNEIDIDYSFIKTEKNVFQQNNNILPNERLNRTSI